MLSLYIHDTKNRLRIHQSNKGQTQPETVKERISEKQCQTQFLSLPKKLYL
jgi:hypothetical protein